MFYILRELSVLRYTKTKQKKFINTTNFHNLGLVQIKSCIKGLLNDILLVLIDETRQKNFKM